MSDPKGTSFYHVVALVSFVGLLAGFIGGFIILFWESVHWLKFGVWPNLVVMDALRALDISHPAVKWVGVQKLIDSIIDDCPLSLGLMVLGVMLGWIWDTVRRELDLPLPARSPASAFASLPPRPVLRPAPCTGSRMAGSFTSRRRSATATCSAPCGNGSWPLLQQRASSS